MKNYELAIMVFGGVILTTFVCMIGILTKRELNKLIKNEENEIENNKSIN